MYAYGLGRLHLQNHDPLDFCNFEELLTMLVSCFNQLIQTENPNFLNPSLVIELGVSLLLESCNRIDFPIGSILNDDFCKIIELALSLKKYHSKSLISELLEMLN